MDAIVPPSVLSLTSACAGILARTTICVILCITSFKILSAEGGAAVVVPPPPPPPAAAGVEGVELDIQFNQSRWITKREGKKDSHL